MKHPFQCSWHRLQVRGKILFEATLQKNTQRYNIFCLQYRHRHIQTQVLCCTDVLPPRSLCAAQRGYHSTLGVFCHILYCKGTSSHRWESGERHFWLREGTGARSGTCPQAYFAKKIPEAVPFTSKQNHDHRWTVSVSLHRHTQEAPKLGRHSVSFLSCPSYLFSPKTWQTTFLRSTQSNQKCYCPQAGVTVQYLRLLVKGHTNAPPSTSAQGQPIWNHLLWTGGNRHLVHGSIFDSSSNLQYDLAVRSLITHSFLC